MAQESDGSSGAEMNKYAVDALFDYLRNIDTSPGPNAGRSIDPTKPGPDADRSAPSPAPSPEPQDVREALKEVLRKHEWDNGYINAKTLLIEHIVAALAQSDARICLGCDLSGECHAFDNPTQVCELCEHHEPLTVEAVNRAFKSYESRNAQPQDVQFIARELFDFIEDQGITVEGKLHDAVLPVILDRIQRAVLARSEMENNITKLESYGYRLPINAGDLETQSDAQPTISDLEALVNSEDSENCVILPNKSGEKGGADD